jgi:hypothetical protein
MHLALVIGAAWIALDVALIALWQLAHVRSRRFGAQVGAPASQRVYSVAAEPRRRDHIPVLVRARRG